MKILFSLFLLLAAFSSHAQKEFSDNLCKKNNTACYAKKSQEINEFNQNLLAQKFKKCEPVSVKKYSGVQHVTTSIILGLEGTACKAQFKQTGQPTYQECLWDQKIMENLKNVTQENGGEYRFNRGCKEVADLSHPKGKEVQKRLDDNKKDHAKDVQANEKKFDALSKDDQVKETKALQDYADELKKGCSKKDEMSCEIFESLKLMSEDSCKISQKNPVCQVKW